MKRLILTALISCVSIFAIAADNTSFTINGSGFGTNTAHQLFLGGSAGPIESATVGTDIQSSSLLGAGWTYPGDNPQTISNTRAFSATHSILYDTHATDSPACYVEGSSICYQHGVTYDTGAAYTKVYARFYTYIDNGTYDLTTQPMQIKFLRFSGRNDCNGGLGDNDTIDTYLLNWWTSIDQAEFAINSFATGGCSNPFPTDHSPAASGQKIPTKKWALVEVTLTVSSSPNAVDGSYVLRVTDTTNNANVINYSSGNIANWFSEDSTRPYRYLILQMYEGNLSGTPQILAYIDSNIYWSYQTSGTAFPKFVLACDASIWSDVNYSNCAVQKWSSWSNTSITVTRNYAKNTGNRWYYVMSDINTPINTTGIADSENGTACISFNNCPATLIRGSTDVMTSVPLAGAQSYNVSVTARGLANQTTSFGIRWRYCNDPQCTSLGTAYQLLNPKPTVTTTNQTYTASVAPVQNKPFVVEIYNNAGTNGNSLIIDNASVKLQ